jgi:hypothetical protein
MNSRKITIRKPESVRLRDFASDYNIANHLSSDSISECLVNQNLQKIIQKIYLDSRVPSNQCVQYIQGFKVFTNNEWMIKPTDSVLREMTETGYRVLRKHYDANLDEIIDYCSNKRIETNPIQLHMWLEDIWDGYKTYDRDILEIFRANNSVVPI